MLARCIIDLSLRVQQLHTQRSTSGAFSRPLVLCRIREVRRVWESDFRPSQMLVKSKAANTRTPKIRREWQEEFATNPARQETIYLRQIWRDRICCQCPKIWTASDIDDNRNDGSLATQPFASSLHILIINVRLYWTKELILASALLTVNLPQDLLDRPNGWVSISFDKLKDLKWKWRREKLLK